MTFPEQLTSTEWQTIILIERLRRLSKRDIRDLVGCSYSDFKLHWEEFAESGGMEYLKNTRSGHKTPKEEVYLYMDYAFKDGSVPLSAGVLADVFDSNERDVQQYIEQWEADVNAHAHFPMCRSCGVRGDKWNPTLENGVCLQCNAGIHRWPLEQWKESGRYVALLYHWGLIDNVSETIRRSCDTWDGAEVHRHREGKQYMGAGPSGEIGCVRDRPLPQESHAQTARSGGDRPVRRVHPAPVVVGEDGRGQTGSCAES
jgi:hypothetical protein